MVLFSTKNRQILGYGRFFEFFRFPLFSEDKVSIRKQKNYEQWYVKFACGMRFPDG